MPGLSVFFWLRAQDACRFIALKTGILVERGVDGIGDLCLVGGFLVVCFTRLCRAEIDYLAGRLIDQQEVLVGMGLLLPTVVLLLLDRIGGALASAFGSINGQRWRPFLRQRAGADAARLTLRLQAQVGQRLLDNREQVMNPIVRLGLAQFKMQRMHGLERMGFLVDQNKQELVGITLEPTLRASTCTALPWLAFACAITRVTFFIGALKGWQQRQKLFQREAGRC